MGQFKVVKDYSLGATLVSNAFIDNYMEDANDAQLKIYLYLLRILSENGTCSISDLADKFNYTEKDVERALTYWHKHGLIALEYDEHKSITGVRMLDVSARNNTVTLAPVVQMPIRREESVKSEMSVISAESIRSAEHVMSSEPAMSATSVKSAQPVRSSESADKKSTSDEDMSELIFVVERYLGRPLSTSEIRTLIFFTDELHFSTELIDYLFEYCLNRDKKDFRYIERVAVNWANEGITTPRQAAEKSGVYNKNVYDVMKSLGKTGSPTKTEIDYVTKWTKDMDFPMDIIYEACERTVKGTDSRRFQYADKILTAWYNNQVHSRADIKQLDDKHDKEKLPVKAQKRTAEKTPQYKQFIGRSYDFDELEKELLSN